MQHGIGFPIEKCLHERVVRIIELVRADSNKSHHNKEVVDIMVDMIDIATDYFFVEMLEYVGIKSLRASIVKHGVKVAKKALKSIFEGLLRNLSDEQMLRLADHVEGNLVVMPEPKQW